MGRAAVDLRDLNYFEAVARHQHVSRAAAELAIAQPALSKLIHELEQELEVRLFERVGRNIRLTEAGQRLHEHIRTIQSQLEAMRADMRAYAGIERGRVVIGTPPTVGLRLLPEVLAAFHRQHPAVELHVRESSTQGLLRLIDEGDLDLAIVTLPAGRRWLIETPLFTEQLVVVVAADHPLASRRWVRFADLADEPFLMYPPGYEMREATLSACRQAGFRPQIVLDGGEIDLLLRLAEVGLGLALMPPLALRGNERLAVLQISDQVLQRSMGLVSRRDRAATPVVTAMRSFLIARLQSAT
jgi:LysR family transcriptional regulator, transcription activator of glutamate synthase operon